MLCIVPKMDEQPVNNSEQTVPVEVVKPKRDYFFKKGNKFGNGRPRRSRAELEMIRQRILRVVHRRMMHEKDLDTVSMTDLLKFLATIMPKDNSLKVEVPHVNYISNVPRDTPELLDIKPEVENGEDKADELHGDQVLQDQP